MMDDRPDSVFIPTELARLYKNFTQSWRFPKAFTKTGIKSKGTESTQMSVLTTDDLKGVLEAGYAEQQPLFLCHANLNANQDLAAVAWVLSGTKVPIKLAVPASAGRDADNR